MNSKITKSGGFPPGSKPSEYPNPGGPINPADPGAEPDPIEFPNNTPRKRAPGEPQPPMPPETPDFMKLNKDMQEALKKEEKFLLEEVADQGFDEEFLPQNVQSDIESALEEERLERSDF